MALVSGVGGGEVCRRSECVCAVVWVGLGVTYQGPDPLIRCAMGNHGPP
jgi:hypothetical protein